MYQNNYKKIRYRVYAENWCICDRCGIKFSATQLHKEEMTNWLVCDWCRDPYHPQLKPRYPSDIDILPFQRIPSDLTVVIPGICANVYAIADEAIADCAIADNTSNIYA